MMRARPASERVIGSRERHHLRGDSGRERERSQQGDDRRSPAGHDGEPFCSSMSYFMRVADLYCRPRYGTGCVAGRIVWSCFMAPGGCVRYFSAESTI